MRKELQTILFVRYPEMFKQGETTCMSRGICCGDGWFDLIDVLCDRIQRRVEISPDVMCEVSQVKEKFGGLKFYISGGDEYIKGLINFAESMSYKICTECGGSSDNQAKRGWIYTLCENCCNVAA